MIISKIRLKLHENFVQWDTSVTLESIAADPFLLWYRFPKKCYSFLDAELCDLFVAAVLTPAMALGEPLRVEGLISSRLMEALSRLQSIYRAWDSGLSLVPVIPEGIDTVPPPKPGVRRVGLFFSLGVDSFFTLLKDYQDHRNGKEAITDLLFVKGFDISIDNPKFDAMYETAILNAERVANELGKNLIVLSTNIRRFTNRFADWGTTCHGAALASVALALGKGFEKIYIASTYDWAHLMPWGSHPYLDPLWSNGKVSLVHDGCEATRLEKTHFIAHHNLVKQTLRVCFENPEARYNCGSCQKCLITMIALQACGALDGCVTLPRDPRIVDLLRSELGSHLLRAIPR